MYATMTDTWPVAVGHTTRWPRRPAQPSMPAWTEATFEAFHREHAAPLWRYVLRVSGDGSLADDIVQESFLRVLRRPALDAEPRRRRAYLFQVATNLMHDRWRRGHRETVGVDETLLDRVDLGTATAGTSARNDALDVHSVLATLRPRERALVWLACVEGCQHDEIAKILGVRSRSVRVMLHRAKKKLAAALAARGYERSTS